VLVAGIDGCRGGWCVATATVDPFELVGVEVAEEIAGVLARPELAFVAIDMPIGLPDDGETRTADTEARRLLGQRRSSVFPTPCRDVLGATTYAEALEVSRAVAGRGLSTQAWNLVRRIRELDAVMTPSLQDRVREAHPELAFARLAGAPMRFPKRTAEGRADRIAIVGPPPPTPRGAAADDVLDAMVLARTAAAMAEGEALRLGDGAVDAHGLRMEVWG
jgi:predicted RNase H-like nuclease